MTALSARIPRNALIVLDNARIHRSPEVFQFFSRLPQRAVFLPPYSPDYNPIELLFGLTKVLMKDYDGAQTYIPTVLDEVFRKITTQQLTAFVQHCRRLWMADEQPPLQ